MLGKIVFDDDIPFYNPNRENLVARVSTRQVTRRAAAITIALIDCGAKRNITRCLLARDVRVVTVPWDWDLFSPDNAFTFDGIMISNGPGNPKLPQQTIDTIRTALEQHVPRLGICLGHQLLALAAGGDTYKLKFGHRSQNQPCVMQEYAALLYHHPKSWLRGWQIAARFEPWFVNANDGSNEGIKHIEYPFFSVQFHPEAVPGPVDTEWLFDYFLEARCKWTGIT